MPSFNKAVFNGGLQFFGIQTQLAVSQRNCGQSSDIVLKTAVAQTFLTALDVSTCSTVLSEDTGASKKWMSGIHFWMFSVAIQKLDVLRVWVVPTFEDREVDMQCLRTINLPQEMIT